MSRKLCLLFALAILALCLAACNLPRPVQVPVTSNEVLPVDPVFREFYTFLGGSETLGEMILPAYEENGVTYQYTEAALLVFNRAAPAGERFSLAPIGVELGVAEPPVEQPGDEDRRYLAGHTIHPDFLTIFDRLGGQKLIGNPLTEYRFDVEKNRYEQYFEKLGFYRLEGDAPGTVRLLAYGAWKCGPDCSSTAPESSQVEQQPALVTTQPEEVSFQIFFPVALREAGLDSGALAQLYFPLVVSFLPMEDDFSQAASRLDARLTGQPLTDPFQAGSGQIEQIFENLVITASAEEPGRITLRTLAVDLGIQADPMEAASPDELFVFYPIEGDLGYNVPAYFAHFIDLIGGWDLSGAPLTRFGLFESNLYRQCFAHFCLEEDRDTPAGIQIRPSSLGYLYKALLYPSIPANILKNQDNPQVTIQVWKKSSQLASGQQQEISISIAENQNAVQDAAPYLILTLPDGNEQTFPFPQPSPDGQARLKLPAISATSGTLIPLQVCLDRSSGERFCVKDTYLIWNNP